MTEGAKPRWGTKRVPNLWGRDARIVLIGEAPGQREEEKGQPFVGRAGDELERPLGKHRLVRGVDYSLANLFPLRPRGNDFSLVAGRPELSESLEALKAELIKYKPNIIVALGAWPAYYLCGVCTPWEYPTGIFNWRGSFLPERLTGLGLKTLVTWHPAYIARVDGGRKWKYIFHYDLARALADAEHNRLDYPAYESLIDPGMGELEYIVEHAIDYDDPVSFDIETFGPGQISCVGFAPRDDLGVCVTHENIEGLELVRKLWESPVPKVMQFGTYDVTFMRYFYGWSIGGFYDRGWDTYTASAVLEPELPKGLDMLASVYTRMPFYKEERKQWKEEGEMSTLWEYNIKDVISTRLISGRQVVAMPVKR